LRRYITAPPREWDLRRDLMLSQVSTDDAQLAVAVAHRLSDELLPKVSGPIEFTRHLTAEEAEVEGW
jgi:hypothetical protein